METDTKRNMESPRGRRQTKQKDVKEKKQQTKVQSLSRMPGHCPLGSCSDIVFPSNLMMHILHKHSNNPKCIAAEIFEHRPLLMSFDPTGLEYGDNCCVANLMYGGIKGKPHTRPGLDNVSLPNSGLLNDFQKYERHLPIMMMVCRSTWFAHLKDKELEAQMLTKNVGMAGIYVLWLVSPITTRKIYYTLTIFDRLYISSRSVIRTVRDFTSLQKPSDFLPIDENYVILRDSEVLELMSISKSVLDSKGKPLPRGIPMELIIYQVPLKPNSVLNSQAELQVALQEAQNIYSNYIMPRTKGTVKREVSGKLSLTRKPLSTTKTGLAHHSH